VAREAAAPPKTGGVQDQVRQIQRQTSQEQSMSGTIRDRTEEIISTIRGEFNEMPGMRLTRAQFCRLWHLEGKHAERVIGALTASGFLRKDRENRYGRAIDAVK
jgi:tRNA G26 N,N-dimethylase Trm1